MSAFTPPVIRQWLCGVDRARVRLALPAADPPAAARCVGVVMMRGSRTDAAASVGKWAPSARAAWQQTVATAAPGRSDLLSCRTVTVVLTTPPLRQVQKSMSHVRHTFLYPPGRGGDFWIEKGGGGWILDRCSVHRSLRVRIRFLPSSRSIDRSGGCRRRSGRFSNRSGSRA